MATLKPFSDHNFRTEANAKGQFVGRVNEFPDLRTRPRDSRLDALDDIMTQTREKLRQLEDASNPIRGVVSQ
jgi:hypothetical protein